MASSNLDMAIYTASNLGGISPHFMDALHTRDLMETSELAPLVRKRAAIPSIKLLAMDQSSESLISPPNAILARGIKIKIIDLEESNVPENLKPFQKSQLTNFEVGVQGEKNIIVPSFGTTSVLFTRHFNTLR